MDSNGVLGTGLWAVGAGGAGMTGILRPLTGSVSMAAPLLLSGAGPLERAVFVLREVAVDAAACAVLPAFSPRVAMTGMPPFGYFAGR